MNKIIYLKYGELVLKGKNRNTFTKKLFDNVKWALKNYKEIQIIRHYEHMQIHHINDDVFDEVFSLLKKIPGILYVIKAFVVERDENKLIKDILSKIDYLDHITLFRVTTKRSDKTYYINSMEFSEKISSELINKNNFLKTNLKNFELEITIEIKKDQFVFYFNKELGERGFPVGINGKVLMLLSGGIDSPIAAKLLVKKGYHVDFLTFITPPFTKNTVVDKVKKLVNKITLENQIYKPKLFVCNFTNIQNEISHLVNEQDQAYRITIMRRFFYRIAEDLKNQHNYDAIATGESLCQVASQTIQSIQTIQNVLKNTVVLRPLLTYDKSEIIDLAIKYETYDISILPIEDSCSLFAPKNPVTKPNIRKAAFLERQIGWKENEENDDLVISLNSIYTHTINKYITIEKTTKN